MNLYISTIKIMMKRFGVELKRVPVNAPVNKGVTISNDQTQSILSENGSLFTKNSNSLHNIPLDGSDNSSTSDYDYNPHHNHNSVFYDLYSSKIQNTPSENYSSESNDNKLKCNICNMMNDNTNFIILSCCNDICHIKCLISKLNFFNENSDMDYNDFNENLITNDFLNSIVCLKCNKVLNYEDIFNIQSKHILNNKKYIAEYDKKIILLKDQKKKIENEIKCLNEYIIKLNNEKQIAQVIMTKMFSLMST
jgi:hypothetical protein